MRKTAQLTINVEEPVAEAIARLAAKKGLTMSAYVRQLILGSLAEHEAIPPSMAMEILAN